MAVVRDAVMGQLKVRILIDRGLASVVGIYAVLSLAQWASVAWVLRGLVTCGNVLSDPCLFLLNVAAPLAATAAVILQWRGVRSRRRWIPGETLILFLGITAGLVVEAFFLEGDCGLEMLGGVWWLRWL